MGWRETFSHTPEYDTSKVGITFVELLFAAVVPFQLQTIQHWWQLRPFAWVQIATSACLLLTSWIGYHNSPSRLRWTISFVNLPLLILVLDVLMVFVYGFSAFAAQVGTGSGSGQCSPVPMAVAVALSFALYCAWDHVNLRLKRTRKYQEAWKQAHDDAGLPLPPLTDVPFRRHASQVGFLVSLGILTISILLNSGGDPAAKVIGIDGCLLILIVLYRFIKEWKPGSENVLNEVDHPVGSPPPNSGPAQAPAG